MKDFFSLGQQFFVTCFAVVASSQYGFSQLEEALLPASSELAEKTDSEILWDQYGIPHIYGPDLLTVVRGYGYAQMENHAELILQKVAEARGRTAEYFGPGAQNANVENDVRIQTYGIPARAQRWFREGGSFQQLVLQAFVAGVNEYGNKFSDSIDQTLGQVLPMEPEDVLAIVQDTIHFTFLPETSNVPDLIAEWSQDPSATAVLPVHSKTKLGSNGWALAPSRTTNANAILMGNPHLPWGVNQPVPGLDVYQWMEANLVIGDPNHPLLNASGVTFPGAPVIAIGFNDYLGWTHTVNSIKNADLYELQLVQGGYSWNGGVLPFEERSAHIKIRQPDGSYMTQTITIQSSVHGPIVAQKPGKALALRVAGLNAPSVVTQYWGMMLSRNLWEFIAADSALQMPIFNVIYADRDGQIMYVFGGRQPVRSGGTYQQWAGILPGDTSSTFWTKTLPWWQLPKTIDPPGGIVHNSNEPPWFSTFPRVVFQNQYPSYIAPDSTFFRPESGALFLQSKNRFSVNDVLSGKESTHMLFAERVLPDLIHAAGESDNATAKAAANVLMSWSQNSDATDTGAILFQLWYQLYVADPSSPKSTSWGSAYPAFQTEWSDADPLSTPVGLADPKSSVKYLIEAATQLQTQFGRLDVPWGDVNGIVLVGHDPSFQQVLPFLPALPASGTGDPFGGLRALYYFPAPAPFTDQNWVYNGDTYVQIVDFTPVGAKAQGLLTYGNASRPGSPHINDQISLFQQKELRPVYRIRSEVEAHAVKVEQY
ncbi:MAG TPA: penicillin acylase family protein [Chthoniobacterales bacterium]|nr:penicillin acylase family protein [Chthoniobacterales bacterium]